MRSVVEIVPEIDINLSNLIWSGEYPYSCSRLVNFFVCIVFDVSDKLL